LRKEQERGITIMTLSFKSLSFKLGVLSIMVSASLALSACQEPFSSHEQESNKGANTINNKSDTVSNVDPIIDGFTPDKVSAEQKMIVNLANYRWTLLSATDNNAQSLSKLMDIKDKVGLSFGQYQGKNTLNYSVGCNTVSAAYQLQGSVLTIGDSMSTKMSCGDLNMVENNLIKLMQGNSQLVLNRDDQPILTQVTSEANTLVWEGRLTAQAKYNSKGETVFWAVNAQMIPCEDNSSQLCLQVKPITYDDQGIKNSEGKWTPFAGDIDGYQHDGKNDEILRLQRYQLDTSEKADDKAPSTSDKSYAYVLDAVIESSIVNPL